jgi:hypothetical protein
MLLIYYTAVGFSVIYLTTVFGFSLKDANGLGNWNWGFNVLAVILIGVISDRFRVRKPFMVVGGLGAAIMVIVYLMQAGHHPSYYTLAAILAVSSFFLGVAYTPWMASFTETVEARNPALTATGLAIWGWIIRVVVFLAFLLIPVVINSVTPLVNYGGTVAEASVKYAPELKTAAAVDPATLGALAANPADPAAGAKAVGELVTKLGVTQAQAVQDLTALGAAGKQADFQILTQHGAEVASAAAKTVGQWKTWYWICVGGIVFFLLSIPLLRGRWRPKDARKDEAEHEAMVEAELAKLNASAATAD